MIAATDLADLKRRFFRNGILLMTFALLTGLAIPALANPRMGLASHLQAVSNGMYLILIGLIGSHLYLGRGAMKTIYGLATYAAFASWLATLVAAALPAGAFFTIASLGNKGTPVQEALITFGAVSNGLAILIASVMILWGLRGPAVAVPGA